MIPGEMNSVSSREALPFSLSIFLLSAKIQTSHPKPQHSHPSLPHPPPPCFKKRFNDPPVPLSPVQFALTRFLSALNLFSCVAAEIIINPIPLIPAPKGTGFHVFPSVCSVLHLELFGGDFGGFLLCLRCVFARGQCRCLIQSFPS